MSGRHAAEGGPDPFKDLEGLGAGLEEAFAKLDKINERKEQGRGSADGDEADVAGGADDVVVKDGSDRNDAGGDDDGGEEGAGKEGDGDDVVVKEGRDDDDVFGDDGGGDDAVDDDVFGGDVVGDGDEGDWTVSGSVMFDVSGGDDFEGLGDLNALGGMDSLMGLIAKEMTGKPEMLLRQSQMLAGRMAATGASEPNVDPSMRLELEQLMRVAELRVNDVTGLDATHGAPLEVRGVNRQQWIGEMLKTYGKVFGAMLKPAQLSDIESSGAFENLEASGSFADVQETMGELMENLGVVFRPMVASFLLGTALGRVATYAFGGYVLPIPREAPLLVLVPNISEFTDAKSLDSSDFKLWICVSEAAHHAVLGLEHVRARFNELLSAHAATYEGNLREVIALANDVGFNDDIGFNDAISGDLGGGVGDFGPLKIGGMDSEMISDLIGTIDYPNEARDISAELQALVAAVSGYVSHVVDVISADLIGSHKRIGTALRRRNADRGDLDRYLCRNLGIDLDEAQLERGKAFVDGVLERDGDLRRLFSDPKNLPTPAEVDAPGLWLARIDIGT